MGHTRKRRLHQVSTVRCACGCGQFTSIALHANPARGYVRGQPYEYVARHRIRKLVAKGYRYVAVRGRTSQLLHRLRAERALGRPLPKGVEVHHVDGTKSDHSPLVICPNRAYHLELHRKIRVRAAGGDPWAGV